MDATQVLPRVSGFRKALDNARQDALRVSLVAIILSFAIGLRFFGLNWDDGFNWSPHPDERAILAKIAQLEPPPIDDLGVLLNADESPWNPRWFPYGSFPLYMLKGVELISALGPGDGLSDLRIPGRVISALADVATVAMIFVLGNLVYGRRTGLLAAALASLAVIHIQLSHFFTVDTLLALFTVVAIYFMYKVARRGRLQDSALAGVFVGLGLATKVSQAPIYAPFLVAHLLFVFAAVRDANAEGLPLEARISTALKGVAVGVAVSFAVLFIVQPYAFLDWSRFYNDVIEQSEMVRRIRDFPFTRQYEDTTPYLYHVRQLATWGFGWPLGIVAWAGLFFVSVRGMNWKVSLAYLALGWLIPIGILLGPPFEASFIGIFIASGIALAALIATLPFRSPDSRIDVLLLSWVTPYFLITGAFEVKFLRYLVPMTPFLLIFGSRMLFSLWDEVKARRFGHALRNVMIAGFVFLIGSTGFYALSYAGLYTDTHTAVRASNWINQNVPEGSTILKEHWEEGLPNLYNYEVVELPLYDPDGRQKTRLVAESLANADYLTFFSNRLYGTIPRLPERYPITTGYYNLLFTGELGYEVVDVEASYPEFLGVGFVDDTFSRPNLPEPAQLVNFEPSPISIGLGFADESFSVYDHPKVIILKNVAQHDVDYLERAITNGAVNTTTATRNQDPQSVALLLSSDDAASQQQGGTWTDIVNPDSLLSRLPVLGWLLVVEVMALLALPITFLAFRPLADRGYLFSKALGLLLVGIVVWLLASLGLMDFSRGSILLSLILLGAVSAFIVSKKRQELTQFVKEQWKILAIAEVVFLVAFFAFVLLRMANPDLWHPFRGGEKPMDLAYLNAVVRSTSFPPYDPWYGGGYINYYYWGQFMVATLIRATGIPTSIAFNLAIPLFFALTISGAYTIVYNLVEGTRRRLFLSIPADLRPSQAEREKENPLTLSDSSVSLPDDSLVAIREPSSGIQNEPLPNTPDKLSSNTQNKLSPNIQKSSILAGIAAALFVTVLGNLDGAIQVGHGVWRVMFLAQPFGEFDFWRSSRVLAQGGPPGHEITEFPFFTFLFADLHAHLMALPFTLLALGLSLAVLLRAAENRKLGVNWSVGEIARLALLGVAVGSLRLINTWDYPTYLIIGFAVVFLAEAYAHGGIGLVMASRAAVKSVIVFVAGYIVFFPFIANYETFFSSVDSTPTTTVLWQFLVVNGLFIFIIGSFFVSESRGWLLAIGRTLREKTSLIANTVSQDDDTLAVGQPQIRAWWIVGLAIGALVLGLGLTAVFSSPREDALIGSTVPFVALLLVLVLTVGLKWIFTTRPDSPYVAFVTIMVAVSLMLVIGLDIFRVENDIGRMNSVFKFYLQIWVMLALASAYLLWRMAHGRRITLLRLTPARKVWISALAVLILSASIYPVLGTQDRLRDRFNGQVTAFTLDGNAYVENTVYRDAKGNIDLETDFEGIRWLQDNVQGSPIVLEGVTPIYRWGSRVSINTGLPSIIGWQWHQQQQRWDYRFTVDARIEDVDTIYSTTSPQDALSLLRKYDVKYVYVGDVERLYYPDEGLDKFETALSDELDTVFQNDKVTIYRVR